MTKHEQATTIRELSDSELDVISGGSVQGRAALVSYIGGKSVVDTAKQVAVETGIMFGGH